MVDIYAPIRLSEARLGELRRYIGSEIEAVRLGRDVMEREWEQAHEDYEADAPASPRNFPFEGACKIVVPTIATTCDAIFARIMNTVFALRPLWTIQPLSSRWAGHAKPTENFLEWAQQYVLRMYDVAWPWWFETVKMGTGFIKMPYVNDVRRQLTYMPDGSLDYDRVIYHLGPKPEYLAIQDAYLPDGDWDVQTAPWVANKFRLTKGQLASRKKPPFSYEGIDRLQPMGSKDSIRQRRDQLEGFERTTPYELYELFEVWMDWDVNDDGLDEPIVVTYDAASDTILRVINNYYVAGYRPYHKSTFMQREGRAYGVGVARMLRQIAEGITTQFRQFIDNATLANVRIWKGKRGSGLRKDMKLYPGKLILLNDPNDLQPEAMGEIYTSQLNVLGSLRETAERRTGLSDVHLGIESPRVVNRMPATNMLSILQEGSRRFDLTIKDIRHSLAQVGESALREYQQFHPLGVPYNVLGEEGRLVEEVWQVPREPFKGQLSVIVTATSQSNNRELEKQSLQQLMTILGQYYEKMLELAVIVSNPNTPGAARELAIQIVDAAGEGVRRLLQAYAVPDPNTFVPPVGQILKRAQPPMAAPQGGPGNGGPGNPAGIPPGAGGPAGGAGGGGMAQLLLRAGMAGVPGMAGGSAPGGPRGGGQLPNVGGLPGSARALLSGGAGV